MKWAVLLSVALLAAVGGWWWSTDRGEVAATRPDTVLNRGIGPEPGTVDPQRARTKVEQGVLRDLFEGLLGYDAGAQLEPAAAEDWTVSDDGLVYRFILRSDARWSNGDPVTAEDFVYTFRRLVDPATLAFYAELIAPIVNAERIANGELPPTSLGVEATSAHELVITLERPTAHFPFLLTLPPTFPVHSASLERHGEEFTRPGNLVSNGAYVLKDWTLGAVIELARNAEYWGRDDVQIDIVRHHVTEEPGAELRRYLAGELDITSTVPPGAFARMRAERPDELRAAPTLSLYYLGFNLSKPKLGDDSLLREALSIAVDRELIAKQLLGRGETPAYSVTPPDTADYDPPQFPFADWTAQEREARAQRLYGEAGYGPENPLEIQLRYNTSETHKQVALAVQDMWRKTLGFEAELVNEQFKVLVANVQAKQVTEIFRLNWSGDYNDAYAMLNIFEEDNPSNLVGYENADYDRLMDSASKQTDPYRRRVFMEEAEALVLADHPLIPIYFQVGEHMVSRRVGGWQDNPLDYHYSKHLSVH